MDPLSILSITNTALGLAGRLGKTLSFLYQLSSKLKYADIKITLLIGYLGSLNAAIAEIADIVKGFSGCIQYQKLAESLSMTLDCTNLSLSFLEAQLDSLRSKAQDGPSMAHKMKMIVRSSEFEEYVNGISCFVNALNLHLNSLQSHSLLEQQNILNGADANGIIEAMKDETSSLYCLADTASTVSRRSAVSETFTALDASFDFDAEILGSKIYSATYRSHLKQAVTLGQRRALPMPHTVAVSEKDSGVSSDDALQPTNLHDDVRTVHSPEMVQDGKLELWLQAQTSLQPTKPLRVNAENPLVKPVPSFDVQMLLLGTSESGESTIFKGIKLHEEGPYTKAERLDFSEIIYSNLTQSVRVVLEAMESLNIPLDSDAMERHVETIFKQPPQNESIPPEVRNAIQSLIRDGGFQACLKQRRRYQLNDSIDFYLQSLRRISASDYVPSDEDMLYSRVKTNGVMEAIFPIKDDSGDRTMELFVYDVGGVRIERKYWIHAFEKVDIVIFTVDIACYDQLLYEDESVNRMSEALTLFNSVVNSRWFVKSEMILCFTKGAKLAAKIKHSPVENYFPDFVPTEPPSLQDTTAYFITRFKNLDERRGRLTERPLTTLVLQDTLNPDEWQVIKQIAWRLCDNGELFCQAQWTRTGHKRPRLRDRFSGLSSVEEE